MLVKWVTFFESLHDDPRWTVFLEKMNLACRGDHFAP